MNDETDLTLPADAEASPAPGYVQPAPIPKTFEEAVAMGHPVTVVGGGGSGDASTSDPEPTAEAEAPIAPEEQPEQPDAEAPPADPVAQQDAPASTAAPHPADSLLQRLENEVDGLLHSPLALANWVKEMAREARKLL